MDCLCNDGIRQRFGIAHIQPKMHKNRLRLFGNVLCASEEFAAKKAVQLEVQGRLER